MMFRNDTQEKYVELLGHLCYSIQTISEHPFTPHCETCICCMRSQLCSPSPESACFHLLQSAKATTPRSRFEVRLTLPDDHLLNFTGPCTPAYHGLPKRVHSAVESRVARSAEFVAGVMVPFVMDEFKFFFVSAVFALKAKLELPQIPWNFVSLFEGNSQTRTRASY